MNIVVIGLGSMGKRRIRLINALYNNVRFFCVDRRDDRKEEVIKLASERGFEAVTYSEIEEVPADEQIKASFVCTSPLTHSNIIRQCLMNGWNVFTEINLVKDGYDENRALAKEKGLLLYLSSTPLFRKDVRYIIETSKRSKEKLNYIYHVGQYLPDWHPWENYKDFFIGDLRTNGCREIMAIEMPWMLEAFGSLKEIQVVSNKQTELDISFNDNYNILLTHTNGNTGVFAVDVVCRKPVRQLEVYGENTYLTWNGDIDGLTEYDIKASVSKNIDLYVNDDIVHEEGYNELIVENDYEEEVKDFFATLEGKKEALYSFARDALLLDWIDRIENEVR